MHPKPIASTLIRHEPIRAIGWIRVLFAHLRQVEVHAIATMLAQGGTPRWDCSSKGYR